MGFLEGSLPDCSSNLHCSKWEREKMKYCLCITKDTVSLSLGMLSVISWGVAEIPQIITNYREKSTEGLSLAFLMTWIVGDLFNLVGCKLEPATLPTQYYMAILYTITTSILASQTIYYSHIYHRLKAKRRVIPNKGPNQSETVDKINNKKITCKNGLNVLAGGHVPSSPIPVTAPILSRYGYQKIDPPHWYRISVFSNRFGSARSLTKSRTPTAGSYLAQTRGSEQTTIIHTAGQNAIEEPLLGDPISAQSAPHSNTKNMLCAVFALTFFFSSFSFQYSDNSLNQILDKPGRGVVFRIGRKILHSNDQVSSVHGSDINSEMGTILGWAMAAIYMGGRLPQICLNMRRGNVEGLNPLMFIFALVGNITYVGSILVSSLEWSKIRPNLPWLVDAGGCVLLDTFVSFFHILHENFIVGHPLKLLFDCSESSDLKFKFMLESVVGSSGVY
ncbi:hypothetical protein C5167_003285 [Papaver somniferum]|uniref:Uncharacterized protein n=1 Tax=Papaver somniferum TaxID=3469 RepID=A0A4Y7L4F7_PAPSO|nr:hypothetical protein C5167_003285 [Papaver somniferum]